MTGGLPAPSRRCVLFERDRPDNLNRALRPLLLTWYVRPRQHRVVGSTIKSDVVIRKASPRNDTLGREDTVAASYQLETPMSRHEKAGQPPNGSQPALQSCQYRRPARVSGKVNYTCLLSHS